MTKSDFGSKTSTAESAKTSNTGDQAFVEARKPEHAGRRNGDP